jgi:hypothetical protein
VRRRRRPRIHDYKEHGLGHLLNPVDPEAREKKGERRWIGHLWALLIQEATGQGRSLPPAWLDRPALSRLGITDPTLLRPFAKLNRGRPYRDQIKPFNFLLAAHVLPLGHPPDVDPVRFQLIAPFNSDPGQWRKLAWVNRYDGKRYGISTSGSVGTSGVARVATYADQLARYAVHPESKSAGPDGGPCGRATIGLLQRRHVHAAAKPVCVGKESNRLEEVESGVEHDWDEVLTIYKNPRADPWRDWVVPILRLIPRRELARAAGVTDRTIKSLRNRHSRPSPKTQARLTRAAAEYARARLPFPAPDDEVACATLCTSFLARPSSRWPR